ncbi:unnamed protein product [Symbiodinium natans]|uniref:Uncharacterized protein n=1 Tax=Symbiodinium natans TaxID=878477 RepID=A0A812URT6_9DINO|nr:unnamed protein product [Symbiodinium natans]
MAHGDPDGGPKISELTQSMVEAWKRWPAFFRFEALLPCQIPRTIQAPELSPFARPLAAEVAARCAQGGIAPETLATAVGCAANAGALGMAEAHVEKQQEAARGSPLSCQKSV